MGHLLLVAEIRTVICSGSFAGSTPTYRLVDDFIPPEVIDVDEAKRRLVHLFFAGHGPADVDDLPRWAALNKTEVRNAIAELGDQLEMMEIDGRRLYHDPSIEAEYQPGDYLLHTFDEATLTYPRLNFPRSAGHPMGETPGPFLDDGLAGFYISGTECPGGWRLTTRKGVSTIRLEVVPEFKDQAEAAAEKFLDYLNP
jgi:hypothetical protein